MPNQTTDMVSLIGHCMAFASWHKQPVPPRPSHAPFPCEVPEKCHSLVLTQIQKILPVFVLWCSAIRKIDRV